MLNPIPSQLRFGFEFESRLIFRFRSEFQVLDLEQFHHSNSAGLHRQLERASIRDSERGNVASQVFDFEADWRMELLEPSTAARGRDSGALLAYLLKTLQFYLMLVGNFDGRRVEQLSHFEGHLQVESN